MKGTATTTESRPNAEQESGGNVGPGCPSGDEVEAEDAVEAALQQHAREDAR